MNETLTTLIAFVGFLIVFSSLVQAVQEALKGMLKLRAGIWERFFIGIYRSDFGRESKSNSLWLRLWDFIIRPFIIPCKLVKNAWSADFVGEFDKRIERVSGNISKAYKLINKLKGTLQSTINDLEIQTKASGSSDKLLLEKTNELINSDEMRGLLGLRLDKLLKIYDKVVGNDIGSFSTTLHDFYKDIRQALNKLEGNGSAAEAPAISDIDSFKRSCRKVLKAINTIEYKISDYHMQLESKADAWLAQLNAEYKRNMLLWTFMIGLAFVLIFNADAFSIYKDLSSNSGSRSVMVERAVEKSSITNLANSKDLSDIDRELDKGKPDKEKVKKAVLELAGNLEKDYKGYEAEGKVRQIETLKGEAEKVQTDDRDAIDQLRSLSDRLTVLYVGLKTASVEYHLANLSTMELPLGWTEDRKKFNMICENKKSTDEKEQTDGNTGNDPAFMFVMRKITGLLLTAFLITFGAPFWNDILKAIVGLKAGAGKKRR